ncbi:MAG: recombinase [Acidimicrobiales bacterium]|nr:recombinase [Acidimicrobiales bacterium]
MSVLERWYRQARSNPKRVVLADGGDDRATQAAEQLVRGGLADAVVLDDPDAFRSASVERAAGELTKPVDLDDPLTVAALMIKVGEADACVGGASRPTADVIRAGLRVLGTAPDVESVSSCFFFVLPDGRPIAYGDCGVLPEPDEDQLAAVAISTAHTFEQLTGEEPRVAMLSFSTKGSAEHDRVTKVRQSLAIARQAAPDLVIDGELQFDAAWAPEVAARKAPDSPVAGRANVFIFPDLDSGNIAYKITERLGGAQAFGPLLQGLGGIIHDLSRGCSVDDIVNVAVIASLQS